MELPGGVGRGCVAWLLGARLGLRTGSGGGSGLVRGGRGSLLSGAAV